MDEKELRSKIREFIKIMQLERELNFKALDIELVGFDRKEIEAKLTLQNDLIEDIDRLRMEGMLPLIKELAEFVAKKRAEKAAAEGSTPSK
jgi:hypothetical protein